MISPLRVAELLVLRADMPRSLHACLNKVDSTLEIINGSTGREARRCAGEMHAALHFSRIEDIFADGLHEYLTDFLGRTASLSKEIRSAYLARRDEFVAPSPVRQLAQVQ